VLNLANEGVLTLLNSVAKVLCLNVTSTLIPLELGKPQEIHTLGLAIFNCGTNSSHNNCKVTVEEMPGFTLLKTGLDQGTLEAQSGKILVECSPLIKCKYKLAGIANTMTKQHVTIESALTSSEGFLCPKEAKLEGLLKTTEALTEPSLCKVHSNICKTEDLVKSIDMSTTTSPVLLNGVANIECKSSLLASGVKDPMLPEKPIELSVSSLTWSGCHPQGSENSCTVTTPGLPTFDLTRTALNLGQATALESNQLKVSIACASLGLECEFGGEASIAFEGASHTAGAGHGMFTASGSELGKLSGGANCPESVKWDALYELPEDTYLGPSLKGQNAYVLA
jgi:hypothetical protein